MTASARAEAFAGFRVVVIDDHDETPPMTRKARRLIEEEDLLHDVPRWALRGPASEVRFFEAGLRIQDVYLRHALLQGASYRNVTRWERTQARVRFRIEIDPLVVVRWGNFLLISLMALAAVGFALTTWTVGFFAIAAGFMLSGFTGLVDAVVRGQSSREPALQDPRLSVLLFIGGLGIAVTTFVAWLAS